MENQEKSKPGRPRYSGKSTQLNMLAFIKTCFEIMPTLYLQELQQSIKEIFGNEISLSQLSDVKTKILNITNKKVELLSNYRKKPHIQQHRKLYRELVLGFEIDDLFFIDESTVTYTDLARRRGHSLKGTPARNSSHHVSNKRFSIIACINRLVGVVYCEVIDTTEKGVDQIIFSNFMDTLKHLIPKDKVCVMDNSSVHNKETLVDSMKEAGIHVLFQSRYSPDYTLIEFCFSWLKSELKREEYITYPLAFLVKQTFDSMPVEIVRKYVGHAQQNWKSNRL
ncbi:predicted protein [Naegleria gruberi]|uniref:Predicted protein n=1 Tax=Naegleria gruberi TaxID=5762 RepID=D2VU45_NAEGR|nr:uncharacterized protein NAEGRDRAFT_72532 [Naegleria gruberi]EFC39566.1 predicted protein [Naegleria gruberi]|eukprot:XP_002672310.1 predicted protein [Naegleria gruberi strain NEG-M]